MKDVDPTVAPRLSDEQLGAAVDCANVGTLLLLLVHQTGDLRWISDPYLPKPGKGLEDPDDCGLPPEIVRRVRSEAAIAIERMVAGEPPAIGLPDPALIVKMLSIAMGEPVADDYGLMIAEDLAVALSPAPGTTPPSYRTDLDALIIGAGVSGICAAIRLEQLGVPYTILERNEQIGGVWLENRYPGAAVDTPSHLYSYSFRPGDWPRWFSGAADIHAYLGSVADEYGVTRRVRFGRTARRARYDRASSTWVVEAESRSGASETYRARLLISAVGAFNTPVTPRIPGLDRSTARTFHSARWPSDLDVTDKRVAVIGNGASAMQIVPAIAPRVEELIVFQLEPHWIAPFPRFQKPVPEPLRALMMAVPLYHAWYRARMSWLFNDKLHPLLRRDPQWPYPDRAMNAANDRFREYLTRYIERELGDRTDLLDLVVPTYPPLGKRLLLDNGWYRTLGRDNVRLVGDRVTSVEGDTLVTADGRRFDADVIVLATGFDVVSFLSTLEVVGKSGQTLHEVWDGDNASAYLGLAVPDFPNLFILYGPNTQTGHGGSLINLVEAQLNHIASLIEVMRRDGVATVEVRTDVYENYINAVDAAHAEMVWTHPGMETYYRNSRGRVIVNNPYRVVDFWRMTKTAGIGSYRTDADIAGRPAPEDRPTLLPAEVT